MTERQYISESAKLASRQSEAKLAQAKRALEHGFKRLEADVSKAELDLAKVKETRDEEYKN